MYMYILVEAINHLIFVTKLSPGGELIKEFDLDTAFSLTPT